MRPLTGLWMLAVLAAAPAGATGYADLVTRALAAPVVVHATAIRSERLRPRDAAGIAPNTSRFLVTAATLAAIAAPGPVPPRLTYLIDLPDDATGKQARPPARDVLLFLRPGTVSGDYALIDARAEVAWTADDEAAVRAVLIDARGGKVPAVTGVASAFRVPGAVPGEAESQFFLTTGDGKPVSLVVLTRPGETRRLTLALGDVIDDAAAEIRPRTLLWYRLACGLPATLPAAIEAAPDVAADYAFIRTTLGPCGRTL